MRDLIRSGAVGRVQQVLIRANWPPHTFNSGSIQFNYDCAGGAWEDLGPHAVTLTRLMLDDTRHVNPTASWRVESATATLPTFASDVDETMNTTLFYGDVCVEIKVSLVKPMDTSIEIKGTQGTLRQTQWYRAEMFNKLIHVKADGTTTVTEYHGRGVEYSKGPWEYLLDYLVYSSSMTLGYHWIHLYKQCRTQDLIRLSSTLHIKFMHHMFCNEELKYTYQSINQSMSGMQPAREG